MTKIFGSSSLSSVVIASTRSLRTVWCGGGKRVGILDMTGDCV